MKRALAPALVVLLGPAAMVAEGRTELDILRARCTEQERQIRTLETEIESLHSQLALERRRSRGVVPSAAPASPIVTPSPATYTVLGGDTVSSIARRYHISADDLMKRNGIEDPTRLRVGQTLTLPADAKVPKSALAGGSGQAAPAAAKPAESKTTATPPAAATRSSSYKVQRGDTLYGIARKHKMSMANLKALNPRIESKIMVGQSLTVSGQPRSSSTTSSTSSQVRGSSPGATPPVSKKSVASKQPAKKPAPPATKSESPPAPSLANSRNDEPKAVADSKPEPRTISSILVMDEISFGDFAEKHGTTPEQLNALNGWDFNHDLVLARGSEIYVPGQ